MAALSILQKIEKRAAENGKTLGQVFVFYFLFFLVGKVWSVFFFWWEEDVMNAI